MTTRLTPDEGPVTKTRATATLTRIPMRTLPPLLRKKFKAVKDLLVYSVPMRTRFRRVTSRDGILLHGKAGWGEAAPFWDYGPEESARWIDAAINEATVPIPFTRRKSVPVNVIVPVLGPEAAAARVEESHGCATAKVKVADPGSTLKEDCARVEAVADALTRTVKRERWIRLDANGAWDVDQAVTSSAPPGTCPSSTWNSPAPPPTSSTSCTASSTCPLPPTSPSGGRPTPSPPPG